MIIKILIIIFKDIFNIEALNIVEQTVCHDTLGCHEKF